MTRVTYKLARLLVTDDRNRAATGSGTASKVRGLHEKRTVRQQLVRVLISGL